MNWDGHFEEGPPDGGWCITTDTMMMYKTKNGRHAHRDKRTHTHVFYTYIYIYYIPVYDTYVSKTKNCGF